MRGFFPLLKLSFKSLLLTSFSMGRSRKNRGKALSGAGAFALLSGVMLYISGTYSFSMSAALVPLGGADVMLMMMSIMAVAFPFIMIVFGSQSMVFSTKDVDLVLSLPVSPFTLMLARVSALYLEALLMCELLLLPAGAAIIWNGGAAAPVPFVLLLLAAGVFLAFITTALALLFGALVSLVISRLPFKNLFNVLFSVILLAFVMIMSTSLGGTMGMLQTGANIADGLRASLAGAVPPAAWAALGILGSLPHLALTAAAGVVPLLAFTWVFSRFYKRILTALSSHRLKTDYKLGRLKTSGGFSAMLRKEAGKLFGTPAYVLNAGVGMLMVIIGCVAALVFRDNISGMLALIAATGNGAMVERYLPPILTAAVMLFASLSYVSAVSISLEGKTLWILKEAPLSVGKIFAAKAGLAFIVGGTTTVIAIPMLAVAFSISVINAVLMALLGLLFSLLTGMAGLMINLIFPRMDAENETMVIKQSASVIVSMLVSIVLLALQVGLFFLLNGFNVPFAGIAGACALLLCGLNAALIALLSGKGKKLFAAL